MVRRLGGAALLLLAACGSKFDGKFTGSVLGQTATVVLEDDGGDLRGRASYGGVEGTVSGKVDGDSASGTVTVSALGGSQSIRFEARLTADDSLEWRYPELGTVATLRREGSSSPPSGGGGSRDPSLVGNWRKTVSTAIASFDTYCTLSADGTFRYGGGRGVVGGVGDFGGVEVGADGFATGEWKTEDGVIHARGQGGNWTPVGRYSVSGSGLVIYPAGGGDKQYWER
jgi:hypothetical protein